MLNNNEENSLEAIVNSHNFSTQGVRNRLYSHFDKHKGFYADTTSMILFSVPFGMSIEMGFLKMSLEESIFSRMMAQPLNVVTSRPMGLLRNYTFKLFKTTNDSSFKKKFISEYVAFGIPSIFLMTGLAIGGQFAGDLFEQYMQLEKISDISFEKAEENITYKENLIELAKISVTFPLAAFVYGKLNNKIREYMGVPSAEEEAELAKIKKEENYT